MTTDLAERNGSQIIEQVLLKGDLKDLTPAERVSYYRETCRSLGLNEQVRKAGDVGMAGNHRVFRFPCLTCGVERWVLDYCWPGTGLCRSCSGKRLQATASAGNLGKARVAQGIRQRGVGNHMWKGGVTTNSSGYRSELVPLEDPLRCMANRTGYAMQHRLVVARAIGRALLDFEEVHHKNGRRADNRLENLELWKTSQPPGVRQSDYHCPGCRCGEVS